MNFGEALVWLLMLATIIAVAIDCINPCLLRHDWDKWHEILPVDNFTAELYVVQERTCGHCGIKQQNLRRKPLL